MLSESNNICRGQILLLIIWWCGRLLISWNGCFILVLSSDLNHTINHEMFLLIFILTTNHSLLQFCRTFSEYIQSFIFTLLHWAISWNMQKPFHELFNSKIWPWPGQKYHDQHLRSAQVFFTNWRFATKILFFYNSKLSMDKK